ncbi:hypothetical protein [Nostoc sp. DedQUE07]|uniref:hypothetical protein n=1 Tax=unclassified Nostoc TaxID=2593658 RepID=UPI00391D032B
MIQLKTQLTLKEFIALPEGDITKPNAVLIVEKIHYLKGCKLHLNKSSNKQ